MKRPETDLQIDSTGQRIMIKPLSVNEAWQGRRFKTPAYKAYQRAVLLSIKKVKLPPSPYTVYLRYGFSNRASDVDNPGKLLIDIMQKKFRFNDKEIFRLVQEKELVKKGKEFFQFTIAKYEKFD